MGPVVLAVVTGATGVVVGPVVLKCSYDRGEHNSSSRVES